MRHFRPGVRKNLLLFLDTQMKVLSWVGHGFKILDSPEEVLQYWNEPYYLRVADFESNENQNFANISNDWPILKESCGYELVRSFSRLQIYNGNILNNNMYPLQIEIDCLKKYNSTLETFIYGWENCFPKLLSLYKKK